MSMTQRPFSLCRQENALMKAFFDIDFLLDKKMPTCLSLQENALIKETASYRCLFYDNTE